MYIFYMLKDWALRQSTWALISHNLLSRIRSIYHRSVALSNTGILQNSLQCNYPSLFNTTNAMDIYTKCHLYAELYGIGKETSCTKFVRSLRCSILVRWLCMMSSSIVHGRQTCPCEIDAEVDWLRTQSSSIENIYISKLTSYDIYYSDGLLVAHTRSQRNDEKKQSKATRKLVQHTTTWDCVTKTCSNMTKFWQSEMIKHVAECTTRQHHQTFAAQGTMSGTSDHLVFPVERDVNVKFSKVSFGTPISDFLRELKHRSEYPTRLLVRARRC